MSKEIKIGDGATIGLYSDAHAATVIAISASGKTITIQEDKATLLNGFKSGEHDALVAFPGGFAAHVVGIQRYSYEPNPDGVTYKVRLTKVGWRSGGQRGNRVTFGSRNHHYDFNF